MLLIRSTEAEACFKTQAAEITSFKKKGSPIECLWQGDPTYWKGRNPILFPIVSNTYSGSYQIDGKTYAMGNHGLARHLDFTVENQEIDAIRLSATSNEETLIQYPFQFKLSVDYHLIDTKLTIKYQVDNLNASKMPFTFGLHPAFNIPLAEGKFSDYKILFEKEEEALKLTRDGGTVSWGPQKEIALDYQIFEKEPTLVFKGLKSDYVQLTNEKTGLEVGIKGFPYLAFWCGNKAPFLCIEPWYGLGDFKENDTKFEEREGMMSLDSGESFNCEYYIKLL